jgi:hypothetical protein
VKLRRNEACPCGSGRKVKRCCGVEDARRKTDAAAELFSLPFHFPRYRPVTDEFDAWARTAADDLARETVREGVAHLDGGERERIVDGFAEDYPDIWASAVAELGNETLAVDLVLGGAVVAGLNERRRSLDPEALALLEGEGAARTDPLQALALALDASDLWSVVESEEAAAALEAAGTGDAQRVLRAEARRLTTAWHYERLGEMVDRVRARLPDGAYPLASAALTRACDRVDLNNALARELSAELLLDSLPRLLAAAA